MCVSALHEVTEFGDDNAQFAFGVYSQFGVEIEESIKNVERNWTGESGGCFVGKCREFSEKISNEADSLERSAETIENIALRTYNTEMKALDMARKRSYR